MGEGVEKTAEYCMIKTKEMNERNSTGGKENLLYLVSKWNSRNSNI
jgi:hypothetical protein